jgi:hypothetical protein
MLIPSHFSHTTPTQFPSHSLDEAELSECHSHTYASSDCVTERFKGV